MKIFFNNRKVKLNLKNESIIFDAIEIPPWYRGIGLTFKRRKNAKALIFTFSKNVNLAIHSWFVFFPFVGVWLDENYKIIKKELVKPFKLCILPSEKYKFLIEIPINEKYDEIVKILVGKERFK